MTEAVSADRAFCRRYLCYALWLRPDLFTVAFIYLCIDVLVQSVNIDIVFARVNRPQFAIVEQDIDHNGRIVLYDGAMKNLSWAAELDTDSIADYKGIACHLRV